MKKAFTIESPRLAICEGYDEKNLVQRMLDEGLVDNLQAVAFADFNVGAGIDALELVLKALAGSPSFETVTAVGLIIDNDEDHSAVLAAVARSVSSANLSPSVNGEYSTPILAFDRTVSSRVAVSTFFSPGTTDQGAFETIVLGVLNDLYADTMACVDRLIECSEIRWSIQKEHKARVHAAISILCERKPTIPLSLLIKDNIPPILPPDHVGFDAIRRFCLAI